MTVLEGILGPGGYPPNPVKYCDSGVLGGYPRTRITLYIRQIRRCFGSGALRIRHFRTNARELAKGFHEISPFLEASCLGTFSRRNSWPKQGIPGYPAQEAKRVKSAEIGHSGGIPGDGQDTPGITDFTDSGGQIPRIGGLWGPQTGSFFGVLTPKSGS